MDLTGGYRSGALLSWNVTFVHHWTVPRSSLATTHVCMYDAHLCLGRGTWSRNLEPRNHTSIDDSRSVTIHSSGHTYDIVGL